MFADAFLADVFKLARRFDTCLIVCVGSGCAVWLDAVLSPCTPPKELYPWTSGTYIGVAAHVACIGAATAHDIPLMVGETPCLFVDVVLEVTLREIDLLKI